MKIKRINGVFLMFVELDHSYNAYTDLPQGIIYTTREATP